MSRFPQLVLMLILSMLLLPIRQARAAPLPSAADFLKQSMARYQALQSFQAACTWREFGSTDTRTIQFARPNRFKVVHHHLGDFFVQTSVCDGKRVAEYSNDTDIGATTYPAPVSIAQATSMQMQHPMFCGSLLYKFFGGPDNLPNLADAGKGPIHYGEDVVINGEPCRTVLFYGTGLYGNTQAAISLRDGLVRRITYDSAPLAAMMGDTLKKRAGGRALNLSATETYSSVVTDKPVTDAAFDTTVPKGLKTTDMTEAASDDPKPPVPLGRPAPDFGVTPLNGGAPVRLSSLRGHVVLLDFWATWCPPCRRSLPETQALFARRGPQGLRVMTISDEDTATIRPFLTKNHYTFPAFRDTTQEASKAYNVSAIPTLAVIDAQGRLAAYFVGLQDPATVQAALKKAGM